MSGSDSRCASSNEHRCGASCVTSRQKGSATVAQSIVLAVESDASYRAGTVEKRAPITGAALKALGKRRPRNFVAISKDDPLREAGVVGHIVSKARARRVVLNGSGVVMSSDAGNGRAIDAVALLASDAASFVGLTPEEAALFVSRFPSDGSTAPAPAEEDKPAIASVFRKVNAWRGTVNIDASKASEVLA